MAVDMQQLRLGTIVEVLHATWEGEGDHRVQSGREWRKGTIIGLHGTSVHLQAFDHAEPPFSLPASAYGTTWRLYFIDREDRLRRDPCLP